MFGENKNMRIESANIRGKRRKNWKKEEIYTVLGGGDIILEKGGEAKISYFGQIYTPALMNLGARDS